MDIVRHRPGYEDIKLVTMNVCVEKEMCCFKSKVVKVPLNVDVAVDCVSK